MPHQLNIYNLSSFHISNWGQIDKQKCSVRMVAPNPSRTYGGKPVLKIVRNSLGVFKDRFLIQQVERNDIETVSKLCVNVFFGQNDGSPWRAAQLRQLYDEQLKDLSSRCMLTYRNSMFKVVDSRRNGEVVGFIEVGAVPGTKYGMGDNIPESDLRPVISNLAVAERARRYGIGSSLVEACEEEAQKWGFSDMVLQVEEDNDLAREFYQARGFEALFADPAARRYDTSGFLLNNVRCTKLTLRKVLTPSGVGTLRDRQPVQNTNGVFSAMDRWFRQAFPRPMGDMSYLQE